MGDVEQNSEYKCIYGVCVGYILFFCLISYGAAISSIIIGIIHINEVCGDSFMILSRWLIADGIIILALNILAINKYYQLKISSSIYLLIGFCGCCIGLFRFIWLIIGIFILIFYSESCVNLTWIMTLIEIISFLPKLFFICIVWLCADDITDD